MEKFVDEGPYAGVYVYAPEDFMTGNEFRFAVYNAKKPSLPHHIKVFKADSELIRQIRSDFREVLGEGASYWENDHASDSELPGTGVLVVTGAWDMSWENVRSEVLRALTSEEIGIVARKGRNGVDLIEVLPASPAYEAGLRTGDTILLIDGEVADPRDKLARVLTVKYLSRILKKIRKGKIQESEWTVKRLNREYAVRVKGDSGSQ